MQDEYSSFRSEFDFGFIIMGILLVFAIMLAADYIKENFLSKQDNTK